MEAHKSKAKASASCLPRHKNADTEFPAEEEELLRLAIIQDNRRSRDHRNRRHEEELLPMATGARIPPLRSPRKLPWWKTRVRSWWPAEFKTPELEEAFRENQKTAMFKLWRSTLPIITLCWCIFTYTDLRQVGLAKKLRLGIRLGLFILAALCAVLSYVKPTCMRHYVRYWTSFLSLLVGFGLTGFVAVGGYDRVKSADGLSTLQLTKTFGFWVIFSLHYGRSKPIFIVTLIICSFDVFLAVAFTTPNRAFSLAVSVLAALLAGAEEHAEQEQAERYTFLLTKRTQLAHRTSSPKAHSMISFDLPHESIPSLLATRPYLALTESRYPRFSSTHTEELYQDCWRGADTKMRLQRTILSGLARNLAFVVQDYAAFPKLLVPILCVRYGGMVTARVLFILFSRTKTYTGKGVLVAALLLFFVLCVLQASLSIFVIPKATTDTDQPMTTSETAVYISQLMRLLMQLFGHGACLYLPTIAVGWATVLYYAAGAYCVNNLDLFAVALVLSTNLWGCEVIARNRDKVQRQAFIMCALSLKSRQTDDKTPMMVELLPPPSPALASKTKLRESMTSRGSPNGSPTLVAVSKLSRATTASDNEISFTGPLMVNPFSSSAPGSPRIARLPREAEMVASVPASPVQSPSCVQILPLPGPSGDDILVLPVASSKDDRLRVDGGGGELESRDSSVSAAAQPLHLEQNINNQQPLAQVTLDIRDT